MAKKYLKRCSTTLLIKGLQIKPVVISHLPAFKIQIIKKTRDNTGEGVEKRETRRSAGGNGNAATVDNGMEFSQKIKNRTLYTTCKSESVSYSVVFNSLQPRGLQPVRLLCPWDFPDKNTGVGCHFLLEGIFPTQGSNPCLLHCWQILYHLSHQGSPNTSVAKPPKLFLPNPVPPDTEAKVTERKFKQREMTIENQDWQTYFTKGHRVNVLGFKDHKSLITAIQLSLQQQASIHNGKKNEYGCVLLNFICEDSGLDLSTSDLNQVKRKYHVSVHSQ